MLGTIILPLVLIFGNATPPNAERLSSGYCGNVELVGGGVGWGLPCEPIVCTPMFCEEGYETADGGLVCLDVDELYPAGHWSINDWREDEASGDSIHYLTEY